MKGQSTSLMEVRGKQLGRRERRAKLRWYWEGRKKMGARLLLLGEASRWKREWLGGWSREEAAPSVGNRGDGRRGRRDICHVAATWHRERGWRDEGCTGVRREWAKFGPNCKWPSDRIYLFFSKFLFLT